MSSYPWVFALSVLLGMIWLVFQNPAPRLEQADIDLLPGATWALACGLVLARLGFAAAYPRYYLEHPLETLWIWQGGLSGSGGLIGALVGVWFYSRVSCSKFLRLFDQLAIPGLIVALGCWIGSWLDGVAYGQPVQSTLPVLSTADMFGTRIARWPAALLGLIPLLGGFMILLRPVSRRQTDGRQGMLGFTGIALSILLASLVRADPMPLLLAVRVDTLTGLMLSIAGVLALLISFRKR